MKEAATKILEHPDKEEILAKLISEVSINDINEWLESKYVNVGESKFILSKKVLSLFKSDYLDFYKTMKTDLVKVKSSTEDSMKLELNNNSAYHKALENYVNNEVDIKVIVKRLVAAIEIRAGQVFDQIQEDTRNVKLDRTLVEWFNALSNILEKYDTILNGSPDNINIQNNINIQVVDDHINVVYNIIKDILTKLDYDTSLLFIDKFNDAMKNLKSKEVLPVSERLEEAQILNTSISTKLDL